MVPHRSAPAAPGQPEYTELAEAIKVVARVDLQDIDLERTRHVQRLRNALREDFTAALEAVDELTSR